MQGNLWRNQPHELRQPIPHCCQNALPGKPSPHPHRNGRTSYTTAKNNPRMTTVGNKGHQPQNLDTTSQSPTSSASSSPWTNPSEAAAPAKGKLAQKRWAWSKHNSRRLGLWTVPGMACSNVTIRVVCPTPIKGVFGVTLRSGAKSTRHSSVRSAGTCRNASPIAR